MQSDWTPYERAVAALTSIPFKERVLSRCWAITWACSMLGRERDHHFVSPHEPGRPRRVVLRERHRTACVQPMGFDHGQKRDAPRRRNCSFGSFGWGSISIV
jgi:hypothetical protein